MLNHELSPFFRQWIGFDKLAKTMNSSSEPQGYPPYNIEKKDENHYRISLALSGFRPEELDVEVEGPRLSVYGRLEKKVSETETEQVRHYLHQGIVHKDFELTFTLAEHIQVSQAKLKNGLLHIDLKREIPDALQPQKIAISVAAEK